MLRREVEAEASVRRITPLTKALVLREQHRRWRNICFEDGVGSPACAHFAQILRLVDRAPATVTEHIIHAKLIFATYRMR